MRFPSTLGIFMLLLFLNLINAKAQVSESPHGKYLLLSSPGDHMEVPNTTVLNVGDNQSLTMSLWMRSDLGPGLSYRLLAKRSGKGVGYELHLKTNGGQFGVNLDNGVNINPGYGSTAICDGNWHHVAVSIDAQAQQTRIFVDGIEEGLHSSANVGNAIENNLALTVGAASGGGLDFNGAIDEIRYWNYAMDAVAVQNDMNSRVSGQEDDLLVAWDFETSEGLKVSDLTGKLEGSLQGNAMVLDENVPMQVSGVDALGLANDPEGRGAENTPIACFEIKTTGAAEALQISQLLIELKGGDWQGTVEELNLYRSDDAILKGTELIGPVSAVEGLQSLNFTQTLRAGSNKFWLSASISENAEEGSELQAAVINATVADKVFEANSGVGGITEIIYEHQDIFTSGTDNTHTFRIPAIVTAPNGDLIAAIDARRLNRSDLKYAQDIDIVIKRSSDLGRTWSPMEVVLNLPHGEPVSDPSMLVDEVTGTIFIFYNYMNRTEADGEYRFYMQKSVDNGLTWSDFEDITEQLALPYWGVQDFKFITSGRGIQKRDGTLMHTIVQISKGGGFIFASDDHGESWYTKPTKLSPFNESKIIELVDGSLMVNSRVNGGGKRYVHRSMDNGNTWIGAYNYDLIDPGCNASILRFTDKADGFAKNRLLFSNAKSSSGRKNMTVRISYDEGMTWSEGKTLNTGVSAYSDLTILPDGSIGLFYEAEGYKENRFARFSLEWLTDGQDALSKSEKEIFCVKYKQGACTLDDALYDSAERLRLKVGPNPCKEGRPIVIKGNDLDLHPIAVYNMIGQAQSFKVITADRHCVQLAALTTGEYIIVVGPAHAKVLVQ